MKGAVRLWASGGAGRGEDNRDDAEGFFGVVGDEDPADDAPYVVWPENRPALDLFLALGTQWRRAGLDGQATGLDYGAIAPTAALMGITTTPELFGDIRDMERVALEVWQERLERERPQ
nr:DUF1799 domain-containing protein [uncultured Azospirillum sp.]